MVATTASAAAIRRLVPRGAALRGSACPLSAARPLSAHHNRLLAPLGAAAASSSAQHVASTSFALDDPTLLLDADDGGGGDGATTFDVIDPGASARECEGGASVVARVRRMGRDEARAAIDRAAVALGPWRDGTTASHRAGVLSKWSSLIKENAGDVAKIMTMESGKPLAESLGEISYGASYLDYYAAEAIRPTSAGGGIIIPTPFFSPPPPDDDGNAATAATPRGRVLAMNEAVGVCALITPWNFPMAMIARKVGPALAVGCSAVVKPSELTPLTAVAMGRLAKRAGVPDGVLEIVTADRDTTKEVGEEFCSNSIVKKISFTGSTPVGKLLMKLSSDTVKRLSLELGGNAAFVVFEDANVDQAVEAAMASKFRNAGQTCVCADRFLVHRSIEEEFATKLARRAGQLNVGHGSTMGVTMGPLITHAAALRVKEKVDEALSDGAECVSSGGDGSLLLPEIGPNYFQPTVLRNVNVNSLIHREETFGPVAAIISFDSEAEALKIANAGSAGLASYFCTRDMSRVFRFASNLECGMVGVNEGIISNASAPFGGVKESGLGREGGSAGLNEYLETKYVFLNM